MLRVLMILEDYAELMFLQTVLKKIGFDVEGLQNPALMDASILRLNPDLLIMTAHGKRVNGVHLSRMVKRLKGLPHIILMRAQGGPIDPDPNIEGWVESPVVFPVLLRAISDVCELDYAALDEKFGKLKAKEIEEEKARILSQPSNNEAILDRSTGSSGEFQPAAPAPGPNVFNRMKPTTVDADQRKARYDQFLSEHKGENNLEGPLFNRKKVHEQVEALRKAQSATADELDKERRAFVEQLFKKK
jgi:hypothetical protein